MGDVKILFSLRYPKCQYCLHYFLSLLSMWHRTCEWKPERGSDYFKLKNHCSNSCTEFAYGDPYSSVCHHLFVFRVFLVVFWVLVSEMCLGLSMNV